MITELEFDYVIYFVGISLGFLLGLLTARFWIGWNK